MRYKYGVLIAALSLRCLGSTDLHCTAKVTNRRFEIDLTTQNGIRNLTVKTDNEFVYSGYPSLKYSPKANTDLYYLPIHSTQAFEIEVERSGQERVAFCLKPNECYACQ